MQTDNLKFLLKDWDFMRILKLGLAAWLGYSAYIDHQPVIGILAFIVGIQAVLNIGYGSSRGCSVPRPNSTKSPSEVKEVTYEEIR